MFRITKMQINTSNAKVGRRTSNQCRTQFPDTKTNEADEWFNAVTYLRVFQKIFVYWTALRIILQPVQLQQTMQNVCNQSC